MTQTLFNQTKDTKIKDMIHLPKLTLSASIEKTGELFQITSSEAANEAIRSIMDQDTILLQEEAVALLLNRNNKVVSYYKLNKGALTACIIDTQAVIRAAINTPSCTGIILAHNHPSGNMKPSKADLELTTKLVKACKLVDIKVFDHLIVSGTDDKYLSMKDNGDI